MRNSNDKNQNINRSQSISFIKEIDITGIVKEYDISLERYHEGSWKRIGNIFSIIDEDTLYIRDIPDYVYSFIHPYNGRNVKILIPVWINKKKHKRESAILFEEIEAPYERHVIAGFSSFNEYPIGENASDIIVFERREK